MHFVCGEHLMCWCWCHYFHTLNPLEMDIQKCLWKNKVVALHEFGNSANFFVTL